MSLGCYHYRNARFVIKARYPCIIQNYQIKTIALQNKTKLLIHFHIGITKFASWNLYCSICTSNMSNPTNQENWPNVFPYMALYWANVLAIVPTLGQLSWLVGKLLKTRYTDICTHTTMKIRIPGNDLI